jgi:hypothetical protein
VSLHYRIGFPDRRGLERPFFDNVPSISRMVIDFARMGKDFLSGQLFPFAFGLVVLDLGLGFLIRVRALSLEIINVILRP